MDANERSYGFIKKKDRWIFEHRTRDCQSLAFPTTDHEALFADERAPSGGPFLDGSVKFGEPGYLLYFFIRGVKSAIAYVVHNIRVEQA